MKELGKFDMDVSRTIYPGAITQQVSEETVICAVQHIVAAHESARKGEPVEWGALCESCCEFNQCKLNWIERLTPLFDAAGIYPNVCEEGQNICCSPDLKSGHFSPSDPLLERPYIFQ